MIKWNSLRSEEDLNQALSKGKTEPIALFKHSTRCPTSFMAKRQIESEWSIPEEEITPYFLDLISFRGLSQRIAQETGIEHESPQLIVISGGKVIYHASHGMISTDDVRHSLAE